MKRSSIYALSMAVFALFCGLRGEANGQELDTSAAEKEQPSLDSLKLQFDIDRVALLKPIRDLEASYEAQLNRLMDRVTKSANLKQALAVEAEQKGYKNSSGPSVGDDFSQLQRLRELYATALLERTETMNQRLGPLTEAHRQQLIILQERLTRDKNLDEAVRVQAEVGKITGLLEALPHSIAGGNGLPSSGRNGRPRENSLGMRFVPVPITGESAGSRTLFFSVWETRVKDYEKFVRRTKREWPEPNFKRTEMQPAVMIKWDEAKEFCQWLTEKEREEGAIGLNDRYRLPSDHEWSCAVGIGADEDPETASAAKSGKIPDVFPWGGAWPPPLDAGNFCGEETAGDPIPGRPPIKGYDDGFERMAPVGSFPANRFGLYDLTGNATELCDDLFNSENPVMRGACYSWRNRNRFLSSFRIGAPRNSRGSAIGFRCVLETEP